MLQEKGWEIFTIRAEEDRSLKVFYFVFTFVFSFLFFGSIVCLYLLCRFAGTAFFL